ncbi:hypothetical protein ABZ612_41755 [Streptomyces avermitilis]|uniref:hypothetical protein n=1 Tax=Streptomyces avermitilis TaxID=33903 RepID=UPI0033CE40B1
MTTTSDIPADDDCAAARSRVWDALIPARAGYLAGISPHYDEVFHDVTQRTQHSGSLGKTDIAALVVWKRLSAQTRWVSALMSLPDTHVRAVTQRAVTAVRDTALTRAEAARTGRGIIWELPGFRAGDALASAILTAAAPTRMAVYDRRVQHALNTLGLPLTPTPGRYGRYLQLLDDLLNHRPPHAAGWTARDIDTALYWTGKPPTHQPPSQKPALPDPPERCPTPQTPGQAYDQAQHP